MCCAGYVALYRFCFFLPLQLLNQIDYYANQNSFFLFQVFSVRVGKLVPHRFWLYCLYARILIPCRTRQASAIVLTLHYLACVWYVVGDQVDGTTWVTVNDIKYVCSCTCVWSVSAWR